MVRHTICFKLIDNSDQSKNKAKEVLLSMKDNVPQVRDMDVYCDFLGSARSFDVILNVYLDDPKALDDYQKDPYHCDVVKTYMHSVAEKSVAVDVFVD